MNYYVNNYGTHGSLSLVSLQEMARFNNQYLFNNRNWGNVVRPNLLCGPPDGGLVVQAYNNKHYNPPRVQPTGLVPCFSQALPPEENCIKESEPCGQARQDCRVGRGQLSDFYGRRNWNGRGHGRGC